MSDITSRRAGSGKYQWLEITISAPGFNYKFDTDPDEIRGVLLTQLFRVVDDALELLGESKLADEAADLLDKILGAPSNQEDEEAACADDWLPIKDAPKDAARFRWLLSQGLAWQGCYDEVWQDGEWLYECQDAREVIDEAIAEANDHE